MTPALRLLPGAALAAASLLIVAGCASDRPERPAAARNLKPPPPMGGEETFFDGRITAELRTGAGFGDAGKPDDAKADGGGRHGGGGFRMGGGGGGRHGRGGGGGGEGGGGGPSVGDAIEQDQINNIRRAAASGGPPVFIHLRFTNHGTAHADVLVADFLSELGNFVVQPEKLSLDPGQSAEVEPMTSRLAAAVEQVDVTLALRLDGRGERKTITLHQLPAPPAPESAAPPKS